MGLGLQRSEHDSLQPPVDTVFGREYEASMSQGEAIENVRERKEAAVARGPRAGEAVAAHRWQGLDGELRAGCALLGIFFFMSRTNRYIHLAVAKGNIF